MWQGKKVHRELVSWFPVPERGWMNPRSGFVGFSVPKYAVTCDDTVRHGSRRVSGQPEIHASAK
jgi:hypothetical protein